MFPTVKNSLSVGVFSCERIAAQFPPLWRKILLRRGQRKVRLSEVRPILITFHLFLVLIGATNIFLGLIHPLLKLLNCVLKQQLHILESCEALGSAFSLFEKQEQALSAYWHIHPLIFDLPENTILYTETTLKTAFAIRGYFECVCTFFGIFLGSLLYGTAWVTYWIFILDNASFWAYWIRCGKNTAEMAIFYQKLAVLEYRNWFSKVF